MSRPIPIFFQEIGEFNLRETMDQATFCCKTRKFLAKIAITYPSCGEKVKWPPSDRSSRDDVFFESFLSKARTRELKIIIPDRICFACLFAFLFAVAAAVVAAAVVENVVETAIETLLPSNRQMAVPLVRGYRRCIHCIYYEYSVGINLKLKDVFASYNLLEETSDIFP